VVSGGSAIAWNPFSGGEHISPQRKKQRVIGNIHHLRIIALAPVFIALLVLALKTVFFFFDNGLALLNTGKIRIARYLAAENRMFSDQIPTERRRVARARERLHKQPVGPLDRSSLFSEGKIK